jgi:cobalt/nickel transport system permease protein
VGEWMFKEDNYVPEEDRDKFIDNSTFAILKVLSKIEREDTSSGISGLYNINPAMKLLFTIANLIFISLSRSTIYLLIIAAYILLVLLFLKKSHSRRIIMLAFIMSFFSAIMLVPSALLGNARNSLLILFKVFLSITIVNTLSYTAKWYELAKSLKLFFIPDLFILILEITLRYIYILGEASLEMLQALRLRSIGRNSSKYMSLSGILGNLFLRSKEMGDELYSAMECRGFTGEYSLKIDFELGYKDMIYLIINIVLVALYFIV